MLKTNWHTHTYRCGHAIGKEEEYVVSAIEAGLKKLGFSDHAPFPINKPGLRMDHQEFQDYIDEVKRLKEKYKDKIEIYLGVECEYYPEYLDTIEYYRKNLDYVILGQHGLNINMEESYDMRDPEELIQYVERVEEAASLGLFDYFAHPDVFLWNYPRIDETVIELANRIADLSIKYNFPLEANCGSGVHRGKRKYEDGERYGYPNREVFYIFSRRGCEIVIGLDIHDPKDFFTDEYINRVLNVIEGLNCNINYDYDLINNALKRRKEYKFTD